MNEQLQESGPLAALLDYLKRSRGFDFSGYKQTSLARRIGKRLETVGVAGFADYMDYLEVHPDEFALLFNTILINVTAFFRDQPAWEYVSGEVLPHLLADKPPESPVRVWSAGCASGEEACTLAMLLAEALGLDAFRERVKIYGTDVDNDALAQARLATYDAGAVEAVPDALREKYFERQGERFVFHKDLRRSVIFGRHDLIQDAPISRLDLLVCRNTLMYFNAEAQSRILDRFHFALNEGGVLFLGKAEMLLNHNTGFTPVDLKRRVFRKLPRPGGARERPWLPARPLGEGPGPVVNHFRLRDGAFDAAPTPHLVVDAQGTLVLVNRLARELFGLGPQDYGRPLQELELSFRPADLKPLMEQASAAGQPAQVKEVEWRPPQADPVFLDVTVRPLSNGNGLAGYSITYADVSQHRRLREELQRSHRELETAYEGLQSTNEELETTNEELQSTVEELETTNEELQSTKEELETMNEELQSANEELQTINEELRQRSDELNQVNGFFESILTSLRNGVVVLDRDLLVLVWNQQSEDLWGLRAEEVRGKHFFNLDIGLPVERLRPAIRACLAGESAHQETTAPSTNRRGRAFECRVTCTPLQSRGGEVRGVILLMEEVIAAK